MANNLLWRLLLVCIGGGALQAPPVQAEDIAVIRFEQQIAPLLISRCVECHHGTDPAGGLDLTTRQGLERGGESGPAIDRGHVSESYLLGRVVAGEMPPTHPLKAEEQQQLVAWVMDGANWSGGALDPWLRSTDSRAGYDWWSFQPLQHPIPPVIDQPVDSPVDPWVRTALDQQQLEPSPPAERVTLIRRLSQNLRGLPPSWAEVQEFVGDSSPDAYERLVDRYLASPHYGERWARHWLDVIRYGESNGFERDLPRPSAWPFRDWVIAALNEDLPYDEFVRRQLAADVYHPDDPSSWQALGFLVAGPHDTVIPANDRMRAVMRQDEMEDLVGTVGQAFLGLTVNCARCHDHKFDPITQKEYYQLTAALAGVGHGEREVLLPAVLERANQLAAQRERVGAELESLQRAAEQNLAPGTPTDSLMLRPIAAWDFRESLSDVVTGLPVVLHGGATQTSAGLLLDGQTAYATTASLPQDLRAKSLEVRVRLANVAQRGGAALSVQTHDGVVFDAIVFGEREPGQWMAGSNSYVRTQSFSGPSEMSTGDGAGAAQGVDTETVHLVLTYDLSGEITAYRNGVLYGQPYRVAELPAFASQTAQVLFGLRHAEPLPDRLLNGVIVGARLYDRALAPAEVRVASQTEITGGAAWLDRFNPDQRGTAEALLLALQQLDEQFQKVSSTSRLKVYTAQLANPAAGSVKVLRRGDVTAGGEIVAAAGIAAIAGVQGSAGVSPDSLEYARRKWLAEWLTDPGNGLFARTIANRVWHFHFGRGLVPTPNDLGFNGGSPSHPLLLEWLSTELPRRGSSLKQLHRQLVTSSTYRQAGTPRSAALLKDKENRWLWRMSPKRMEAEAVRDAILTAADLLDDRLGGPSYEDFKSFFFKGTQFYEPLVGLDQIPEGAQRRTVYRMWARSGRSPLLDAFDCPDPSVTTPKRSSTTTPLQALAMLNNALVWKVSDDWGTTLLWQLNEQQCEVTGELSTEQTERLVEQAFQTALQRAPTITERAEGLLLVQQHGPAALCRVLFNLSEFLYVE